MKTLLALLCAFALAGCASAPAAAPAPGSTSVPPATANKIEALLAKLPPNAFDTIDFGITIGPFSHTAKFVGGELQSDGSIKIRNLDAQTTFMGYGVRLLVTNLITNRSAPPPTASPAPAAAPPKAP